MKRFKEIWKWYWGDGSTIHPSIPPYTLQVLGLLFVGVVIYKCII